jgi:hypothetical protein
MPATPHDPAIPDDETPDRRIGACPANSFSGQRNRFAHESAILSIQHAILARQSGF